MHQLYKQSQIDSKPRAIRRARRIVEECPTVDAIPVQWIEDWLSDRPGLERTATEMNIMIMINDWQRKKEKQK